MPQIPDCVGTYEEDHPHCNGDPNGKTEQDRVPCTWRNRCAGLRIFCDERGEAPEFIVAHRTYEQLLRLCEKAIGEHGIVDGIAGAAPPPSPPKPKRDQARTEREPAPAPRATKPRPRRKRRPGNPPCHVGKNSPRPAFRKLIKHFEKQLRAALPGVRFFDRGDMVLVRPGTVYRVDRTARAGYVAWYCTTLDGPRPLARVHFLPRTEEVNAEVPAKPEQFRELLEDDQLTRLNVRRWDSGYFRSRCQHLDRSAIDLCAATVGRLALAGALELRGCFGS